MVQGVRRRVHERRHADQRKLQGHRRSRRSVLRLRPRDRAVRPRRRGPTTNKEDGQIEVPGGGHTTRRRPPRPSAAGDEHGSGGPPLAHARVLRDETLQHPRTVFQIVKRHYARYTPEMVTDVCGIGRRGFRLPRPLHRRELRARAHHLLRVCRRVDAAHPGRPIHPHRNDFATPAGQRRAARAAASWRCAATPAIQGSTDIPTLVRSAARLPADAQGGHARHPRRLPRRGRVEEAEGLLGQRRRLYHQPAQGVVGRRGPGGQRLGLRLPAAAVRPARHLPDRDGDAGRRGGGLLPAGPESRGRLGARPDAAPRHVPPEVAGGPRSQPHRVGHLVEGRSGDRVRRTADRGHRDRGVLLARGHARGEGGIVHPDAAPAAVAAQGRRAAR